MLQGKNPSMKFEINKAYITHIQTKSGNEWCPQFYEGETDGRKWQMVNLHISFYGTKGENEQYPPQRSLQATISGYLAKSFNERYRGGVDKKPIIMSCKGNLEFVCEKEEETSEQSQNGKIYNKKLCYHNLALKITDFAFLDREALYAHKDNESENVEPRIRNEPNGLEDDIPF
jgi:hypothetical protein